MRPLSTWNAATTTHNQHAHVPQMNQAVGEFQEFSTSMKDEMEVVVAKADKRMRPEDLSPRMSAADYDEHIANSLRSL